MQLGRKWDKESNMMYGTLNEGHKIFTGFTRLSIGLGDILQIEIIGLLLDEI